MSERRDVAYRFENAEAYEGYMGRWSRAACAQFLPWIEAPAHAAWLDLGCGTGVMTEAVLAERAPASVEAIDPSEAQVALARRRIASERARFNVADACALPYADGRFDVVASALVVNFIRDRPRAIAEMHRVLRTGGVVAAFVWDFAEDRSPSGPVRQALAALGVEVPPTPGTEDSGLQRLAALFAAQRFTGIATRTLEVTQAFASADAFWEAQAGGYSPVASIVKRQAVEVREAARAHVREVLTKAAGGGVTFTARAHAVKARKP